MNRYIKRRRWIPGTAVAGLVVALQWTGRCLEWYPLLLGPDGLLYWEKNGNDPTPNIAKSWEVKDDGRTTILRPERAPRQGHFG